MSSSAIVIDHVSKTFRQFSERNQSIKSAVLRRRVSRYKEFVAIDDVSFSVSRGETFGLIGSNGSGKSTLLKCMARILTPNAGSISMTGSVAAMLEVGSGFHPELSGRENIFLNGAIQGLTRKEVTRVFDEIVDFSGVGDFINEPVKNYSSGMYVRLGFSAAVAVRPDILLADEILAVGDMDFQAKCFDRIEQMRREGTTIVLVSHDTTKVARFCTRTAWMEHGRLMQVGETVEVTSAYEASVGRGGLEL